MFNFSIKDLFDEAGVVTTAGSKVLKDSPPASQDAIAVARLKAAGGLLTGRTTMSEFAFSGVGYNPHYGTPANPHSYYKGLARATELRITGGSSSGAAASVGSGESDLGLGSDTGGSLRIPAALCGLVGFKSTARRVPTDGAFPLSPSLDTVGAITRDIKTAIFAHEILAARKVALGNKPLAAYSVAVVKNFFMEGADEHVRTSFEKALQDLSHQGLQITSIDLPEVCEVLGQNDKIGFSPIESYRYHKNYWETRGKNFEIMLQDYDPRVAARIMLGAKASEADYAFLQNARIDWMRRMSTQLQDFDAVLSPTVPITAPTIASIEQDDRVFFRVNALLLRNPAVVNLLDGCAVSLPCQASLQEPVGLMIWGQAMQDDIVLNLAQLCESVFKMRS